MIGKATLKIDPATRDELKSLKRGGENYDAVIRRLMKKKAGRP